MNYFVSIYLYCSLVKSLDNHTYICDQTSNPTSLHLTKKIIILIIIKNSDLKTSLNLWTR